MSNDKVKVPMVVVLLSNLFFEVWGLVYGCMDGHMYAYTDSHMTTKIFEIDGLPYFLGKYVKN